MNKLSLEELKIINQSLEYTNNLYIKQNDFLKNSLSNKGISSIKSLKKQKSIIKKKHMINNFFTEKLFRFLNTTRNESNKKNHIKSIPYYLKINDGIINNKKNK